MSYAVWDSLPAVAGRFRSLEDNLDIPAGLWPKSSARTSKGRGATARATLESLSFSRNSPFASRPGRSFL